MSPVIGGHPNERPLPAGLLVRADPATIASHFTALIGLQPVRHMPEGLVCAPRVDPEGARAAMAGCPLPLEELAAVPGWPDPPAARVAGWYRRSPTHAPAPAGVRELIQPPGEGFGPLGHATTAMCLAMFAHLPAGPAFDAGCGSGLLAQAWAADGRGAVAGCDLDPRAVAQARAGIALAGLADRVRLERRALEGLDADELAGGVLLANVPAGAHHALLGATTAAPRAAVLSGLRPDETTPVIAAWAARGMAVTRTACAGGFVALALRGTA